MLGNDRGRSPSLIRDRAGVVQVAAKLGAAKVIGIDTEFIRERTFYPAIALIQVATRDEAWLLDPLALSSSDLAPLLDVLRDRDVLKIMHAAYADQECLFWAYGIVAEPVLDTAVAAALCGLGDNVGLGNLLRELLKVNLPKGLARAKWLDRPLPKELMEYALLDVIHLVELGETLRDRLEPRGRFEWALEESFTDTRIFDESPDEIARRIAKSGSLDPKTCAVLVELVHWRENRAKTANLPRNWVADNETLRSIAKVKPRSVDELGNFRGLNRREVTQEGRTILAAIERGMRGPAKGWPSRPRGPIPTENENRAVDLIKAYVNLLASKYEIAPRFLLSGDDFFQLLQLGPEGTEEWVRRGVMTARGAALVGSELRDFLAGRNALALRSRQVQIIPVHS